MNKSKVFTIISLLLAPATALACFISVPQSADNMIYRLVEDVSPYYIYEDNHSLLYVQDINTEADNLKLWREQTKTSVNDKTLKWYVYTSTPQQLESKRAKAVEIFGQDGYRLLTIAKECEQFRQYINDPWYYPCKDDPRVQQMRDLLGEVKSYQGRYASRYALQAIRIMVSLNRYKDAIAYWEANARNLPHDVVKDMAERHVARAYLLTGNKTTAAEIYARHGDLGSLSVCGLDKDKAWEVVYEHCPDSPFFPVELQFLLTHLDNHYCARKWGADLYESAQLEAKERRHINSVLALADRAIREHKVKDVAMWYYARAALLDIMGQQDQALAAVKAGEKACTPGTFLATSMRVLRILIEAETCNYDSNYEQRLLADLKWLDANGRKSLTGAIKKKYMRQHIREKWGDVKYDYWASAVFDNRFYWNDVMNRILVDVLAPRLEAQGHRTEALLYANLGVFWIMKNVYGKAESPNEAGVWSTTNLSNAMTDMVDTCSAAQLVEMYGRIAHPTRGIDSLVVKNGIIDKDYWSDIIGTHYIAEQQYTQAAAWLKDVSRSYQKRISTWPYYDRDPFCPMIGWSVPSRTFINDKWDYKLRFANEMARLQDVINSDASPDVRGEAMIRYGIGLRNQFDWCWALTRNYDSICLELDFSESQAMIDRGIATLADRELKAHYLHLFVRNKEVMDFYADTHTAASLRAHCDMWRDYVKK